LCVVNQRVFYTTTTTSTTTSGSIYLGCFFLIVNIILHVHVCTCNKCNFIWKSGSQTKLNWSLSRKTRSFPRVANAEGRRVGLSVLPIVNRRVQNHANAAYSGIFLISLQVETRGVWREIGENAWSVLYVNYEHSVLWKIM